MLLGYVKDIMRRSLLIGLPFNLSGFGLGDVVMGSIVGLTETSDVFSTLGESEEGKAALEEVDLNLLYKKNQRVVVVVINLRTVHISTPYHPQENNVKIIDLSMRPSLLNPIPGVPNDRQCLQVNGIVQGEVTQKEDYGYAINLGFAELSGFFKCDTATTDRTSPRSLPHSSPRQRPSLLRRLHRPRRAIAASRGTARRRVWAFPPLGI